MSELPLRRVQSAKINNLCKLYPTISNQHQSLNHKNSVTNNPNLNDNNNSNDQHSLIEQRQKISQQILMARSQVVPLRQKAAELTEKMKFLHPNLLFEIEEPETPESLSFSRLGSERVELEITLRQLEDLASAETENKFENDISRYKNNLETIKELVQRGSDTLREKRNSFDVIVHSEIYARVIEQRNEIEILQKRLNELQVEAQEISENTSSRINEIPEIRKLNQKVMFFQKRLCSLKHEKNYKMDELARIRNTRTPRKSPRAKSRRRMNSGIELKKRKQQQLQHQQQQQQQMQQQVQIQQQSSASISQLPLLSKTNILSHSMRSKDFHEILQPSGIRKSNSNSDIKGNGFSFNDSDNDSDNENDSTSENTNDEAIRHEDSNSESDSSYSYFNNKNSDNFNDNNINQNDEDIFESRLLPSRDARRNIQNHDITMDDRAYDHKNTDERQKKKRPNLKISIDPINYTNSPPRLQFFDFENDENFSDGNNGDKSANEGCLSPMAEPDSGSREKSPRVVRFAFDYERLQNQ